MLAIRSLINHQLYSTPQMFPENQSYWDTLLSDGRHAYNQGSPHSGELLVR